MSPACCRTVFDEILKVWLAAADRKEVQPTPSIGAGEFLTASAFLFPLFETASRTTIPRWIETAAE
jgi:hypothetical protein